MAGKTAVPPETPIEVVATDPTPAFITHTGVGGGIVASIWGWLPPVLGMAAAAVGMIYYLICIWESPTVQHYMNNRRMLHRAKKILRLQAQAKVVAAELEGLETVRAAKREASAMVETAKVDAAKAVALGDAKATERILPVRPTEHQDFNG